MRARGTIYLLFALLTVTGARAFAADNAAPAVVAGRVFLDVNGNGTMDTGEKPLKGVRVTDGVGERFFHCELLADVPTTAFAWRRAPLSGGVTICVC